jgi:hypothetical protein
VPSPKYHYLLEYLAELWEATPDKKQFYNSIQLSEVVKMCAENLEQHLKEKKVLIMADLTPLLPCIPVEDRWWLPSLPPDVLEAGEDAGMLYNISTISAASLQPDMVDLNPDNLEQEPASPDNQAPSPPATPEKDEDHMDNDKGETPRRVTRGAAKCSIVISPTQEGLAAQRAKVVDPVS